MFVIVVGLLILPVMNYVMTVTRTNRVLVARAQRVEAVKGGLRAALVNPTKLYAACVGSGRTASVALAVPPGLGIESKCTTTKDALADVPADLRWALTTVQAGSDASIPAPYTNPDASSPELDGNVSAVWCTTMSTAPQVPCGKPYPGNGALDTVAWINDSTEASTGSKIFSPELPPFSNTNRYKDPFDLLTGDVPCKVYFPGKYIDRVVITGSTPVYFVSGVYYFENELRISGDANVVVGAGITPGCADSDAIAVAETENAPLDAYSNGVGGTFVFGSTGRFVVDTDDAGTGAGASIVFNRRLVGGSDPLSVLNNVSVMSVNGVSSNGGWNASTVVDDLDLPGQLHVPASRMSGVENTVAEPNAADPWKQKYKASSLVSTATAPVSCALPAPAPTATSVDACPIIDFSFTTSAKVTVKIPGYIAVPQGSISIQTAADSGVNKAVTFGGGVLAAQIAVNSPTPDLLQLGLLNPVVQKTFKITTTTTEGKPVVESIALVQVNETGGYAVNAWVVEGG